MSAIGIKIKETRTKKGLSQEDLAELSKVNLRTIQRIESNDVVPREKTLKLIYEALDIVVLEQERVKIDKYLVWSSGLTLLIVIATFLGWLRKSIGFYPDGNRAYRTTTGWTGATQLNDYDLSNWLLSISSITVGLIVVAHSLGFIKNKFKYIALQVVILFVYGIGILWSFNLAYELRPGLFILVIATILLIVTYWKKDIVRAEKI